MILEVGRTFLEVQVVVLRRVFYVCGSPALASSDRVGAILDETSRFSRRFGSMNKI